jgi:hypothetical protein
MEPQPFEGGSTQTDQAMPFFDFTLLPTEVFLTILSFLPWRALESAGQVNQHFRQAATDQQLWNQLTWLTCDATTPATRNHAMSVLQRTGKRVAGIVLNGWSDDLVSPPSSLPLSCTPSCTSSMVEGYMQIRMEEGAHQVADVSVPSHRYHSIPHFEHCRQHAWPQHINHSPVPPSHCPQCIPHFDTVGNTLGHNTLSAPPHLAPRCK